MGLILFQHEPKSFVFACREDGAICRSKVLVYKPPGLHPGDIHIFEAVWNRAIEAVVGKGTHGIVFSTQGPRSVTDEMAGSDLDGDQYWVCWHPEVYIKNFLRQNYHADSIRC